MREVEAEEDRKKRVGRATKGKGGKLEERNGLKGMAEGTKPIDQ